MRACSAQGQKPWSALKETVERHTGDVTSGLLCPAEWDVARFSCMPSYPGSPDGALRVERQSQQIGIRFRWANSTGTSQVLTLNGQWPFPFLLIWWLLWCGTTWLCLVDGATDHCLRSPAHSTQLWEAACFAHHTYIYLTLCDWNASHT